MKSKGRNIMRLTSPAWLHNARSSTDHSGSGLVDKQTSDNAANTSRTGLENQNQHDSPSEGAAHEAAPKPKTSLAAHIKKAWATLGLDWATLRIMCKGALAPTIALAAYQSKAFAYEYTTLGYLVAIVSVLSFAVMPRAKFLETLLYLVLSVCLASATNVLAIFCCVHARINTTAETATGGATSGSAAPGSHTVPYNPSAATIAGFWLFVQVYLINTIRARNPQWTIPAIVVSIFAIVSMVYAPQFASMTTGLSFMRRLLLSFLTGLGLGAGVSLLVFPLSSRQVLFQEITAYVGLLRKTVAADLAFIESMEHGNMFSRTPTGGVDKVPRSPEAQAIKDSLQSLTALHGKVGIDLKAAKREIARGKLGPDDLQDIFRRLRDVMLPVLGLSSIVDVFERITEGYRWEDSSPPSPDDEEASTKLRERDEAIDNWHKLSGLLKYPFEKIVGHIDQGLQHVIYVLQLTPRPKDSMEDVERSANEQPGQKGFTTYFKSRIDEFDQGKTKLLKVYADLRGIVLPPDFFDHPRDAPFHAQHLPSEAHSKARRQLYLVLYMDFLMQAIARSVAEFCEYVDAKEASGALNKSRLIVPGLERCRKWFLESCSRKTETYSDEQNGLNGGTFPDVYLGDAYNSRRRDPDHLPPTSTMESIGDRLRAVTHFLRSPASGFGLRCSLAVMSIGIVAYLHNTQAFFVTQRLFWAEIMTGISMTPSNGASLAGFAFRLLGTLAAVVSSYIVWYIVDGQAAGVIIFFFIFSQFGFFILLKFPKYLQSAVIYIITLSLILGYELQVKSLGMQVSESNGQKYYPIYILAVYRLGTVFAGLFVAWLWTIFPWPISEHSELRNDLGSTLYLLANYYSVVQETIRVRVSGSDQGLSTNKNSPYDQLEKARFKIFARSMLVTQSLRTHASFLKFEIPIGGRFPKDIYAKIISRVEDIMNFSSLLSYASRTFADMHTRAKEQDGSNSEWLSDFRRLTSDVHENSHETTTLLVLLSASVLRGQPLPPHLQAPKPFELTQKLDAVDRDILSVRHVAEPGYAAFACMQIATRCIGDDLRALLRDVRELVGELDFSLHVSGASESTFALGATTPAAADEEKTKGD